MTTELGRFNLEANLSPRTSTGRCLREMEDEAMELIDLVSRTAASFGSEVLKEPVLDERTYQRAPRERVSPWRFTRLMPSTPI